MPGRVENMKRACDVYEQTVEERQAGACHLAQRETRSQPRHVQLASTETAVGASKTFFRTPLSRATEPSLAERDSRLFVQEKNSC